MTSRQAFDRALLLALALGAAAPSLAQSPAPAPAAPAQAPTPTPPVPEGAAVGPQQVEITGGRASDTEQRRQSTAAKIVIGREEIEKFGDSTLGEVLRRLPGVTTPGPPGRGGAPRMRGLGSGYTQLLIDGQRIPAGFSFDSLTPEQIERIEILRAPTAETGARAIAGTINIVTRGGYRRRLNELRLGSAYENGEFAPSVGWTYNNSADALTYNLSASVFRTRRASSSTTETTDQDLASGAVTRAQTETTQTQDERRGLNLTSRLQWQLGEAGDTLMLMPTLFHSEARGTRRFQLDQSLGATPPPYDEGQSGTDSRFTNARLNGQWRQRLGAGSRIEVNGGAGGWRAASDSGRVEFGAGGTTPLRTLQDNSATRERAANLTTKLSMAYGGDAKAGTEHSLVTGAEIEALRRDETRTTVENGQPLLAEFGDNLQASSLRLAAYVQDEWSPTPNWSAHAGLRWEGIRTQGDAADGSTPENRSSVVTPLLHAVWKPDPKSRDQLRLSLTRSYRAPSLGTLIARPSLNSRYPPPGPNTPTNPDRAGNPDLMPELATGIDIAIESYLEGGGVLSASAFRRRITDLMRSVTSLETVSWSPLPRWVARQQNIGGAVTQGVELDAKFRLDQAIADAPRVDLRANLSLFASRVDAVPGPDNRLDQQPKASANLGADYRLRSNPLTTGGNVNWVPGYRTALSDTQVTTVGRKLIFDAYALWSFNPATALRVMASNLAPADYESTNSIDAESVRETARTVAPTYINWQVRLEMKL